MARHHDGADPALDEKLDALYAVPLEDFVSERTRLAGELRASGDGAAAGTLAKAPKPTLSAWAVNQLARHERASMGKLAEASARVRKTQLGMIAHGGREQFAAAQAAQREELRRLRDAAERILGEAGHAAAPALLERVSRNLRAMVTSDEIAEEIEAGRLARDLSAEAFVDLAALASGAPPPARKHEAPSKRPHDAARARAEARAEERRQAHERAAREKEVTRLRRDAEHAVERARRAVEAAERAHREAREADEEVRRARVEAEEARGRLAQAERSRDLHGDPRRVPKPPRE
jgi:hypothetical protein